MPWKGGMSTVQPQRPDIESLARLPQRLDEVWQGSIVRLPAWVRYDAEAPPARARCAIWVGPC